MAEVSKGDGSAGSTAVAEHVPSGMKATLRAQVGDQGFDPARPRVGRFENPSQTAASIIEDTNKTFSALDQTHHSERLRALNEGATHRSRLLVDAFMTGKISREVLEETISRMHSIVELGGIVDPMTFAERPDRKDWVFNNAKRKAKKYGKTIYVEELDVTGFKGINDDPDLGHSVGDAFLKRIGTRLTQASYEPIPDDTQQPTGVENGEVQESKNSFNIIRLGGDEFLIVEVGDEDPDLTRHKKLANETPTMMRSICSELGISYEKHPVAFHSGVAVLGSDQEPQEAIDEADKGVIASKQAYYQLHPELSRRQTPR